MKNLVICVIVITLSLTGMSMADQSYGSYMAGGMYKQWVITDGAIGYISGLAWDPTHTDVNGDYDILYGGNAVTDASLSGLYYMNVTNESIGTLVTNATTDKAWDVTIDSTGTVYVSCDGAPQIWKVESPLSSPTITQIMGNVRDAGDDDPICMGILPAGFDNDYEYYADQDIIVFDKGLDNDAFEAVYVLNNESTPESPMIDVVWEDTTSPGYSWAEVSQYDGYMYLTLDNPTTDLVNGESRYFIKRLNSSGVLETVFMDIDPALLPTNEVDDAITFNPADGSIWIAFDHGTEGRAIYRLDVANATDLGDGSILASTTKEITLTGDDLINVANNSMAFSPDGKFLACGDPAGDDRMTIFSTVAVPEPTSIALLSMGLAFAFRKKRK